MRKIEHILQEVIRHCSNCGMNKSCDSGYVCAFIEKIKKELERNASRKDVKEKGY